MRMRTLAPLALVASAVLPVLPAASAPQRLPFRATLTATSHIPKVGSRWRYTVRVRNLAGRPVPASLRIYVLERGRRINTVGWFGTKGTFTKTFRWQSFLRGHRLTFRVVVIATGGRATRDYWVRPR